MLVSINWLKDYADIDVPVDEFCDRMILSGSNIETVEPYGTKFTKIVAGKILKIEKHPDADKLVVCTLDAGQENTLQIVTGAKNVFEGAMVPVILHGGKLPDGTVIKKGKLRGVESEGMLCSAAEMGYEDKVINTLIRDGIWILDDSITPGTDISEALELKDHVVDFEITPNRPDCLSMIGMAREAAAVFGTELNYPDTSVKETEGDVSDYVEVEIKRPDLCPRYTAHVITDIKVEQSPWWMQRRLMHAGMRPINNIVDITNFVMMEYGQPIHAFDATAVAGGKIIVEAAKEGDKFTTLDGVERIMPEGALMICDAEKQIGIAGVMGGLNSEITEDTKTVILEVANFNGDSIRSTSKKLALRTEASSRYEKGIDANLCEEAAERVCHLIELLGCGKIAGGTVDVYPEAQKANPVDVRVSRVNHILGTDIPGEDMVKIFESLEMKCEVSGDTITVTPPTVRQDLEIEEDYVEEVARMFGYDKMPTSLPKSSEVARLTKQEEARAKARNILTAMGVSEILTYSFVSPRSVEKVNISETDLSKRNFVKLINPLGDDSSVMRTMLTPNMMDVLAKNYTKGNKDVKLFEIGRIFNNVAINCDGQPAEAEGLCIGMYGEDADFFTLKGMIDQTMSLMGLGQPVYEAERNLPMYHPGRCANIIYDGELLGTIGEIHPDVSQRYGIGTRVYSCELLFSIIMLHTKSDVVYKPLPKYPAVTRDISLIVSEDVTVGAIEDVIFENGEKILEDVALFDVYRGRQVGEGKKSAAFALTYRDAEKTLTDEEVNAVHSKVLEALRDRLGAVQREM